MSDITRKSDQKLLLIQKDHAVSLTCCKSKCTMNLLQNLPQNMSSLNTMSVLSCFYSGVQLTAKVCVRTQHFPLTSHFSFWAPSYALLQAGSKHIIIQKVKIHWKQL